MTAPGGKEESKGGKSSRIWGGWRYEGCCSLHSTTADLPAPAERGAGRRGGIMLGHSRGSDGFQTR